VRLASSSLKPVSRRVIVKLLIKFACIIEAELLAKPQLIPTVRFVLERRRRRDIGSFTIDHGRALADPLLLGHRLVGDDVLAD
jgi:hypothetical protein